MEYEGDPGWKACMMPGMNVDEKKDLIILTVSTVIAASSLRLMHGVGVDVYFEHGTPLT
jgi:hypothetical protein